MKFSRTFSCGTLTIPLTINQSVERQVLISDNKRFALLVDGGRVHVYHTRTGYRISTSLGFISLVGACDFIERIDAVINWDSVVVSDMNLTPIGTAQPPSAILYDAYNDACATERHYA